MSNIIKLEVSNFKRIKYALIEPSGKVIIVGGLNGQGKTSLLDAIQTVYGGKNAMPTAPLRKGTDKGYIKATESSGVTTERRFTERSTEVKVTDDKGRTISSPQSVCDDKVAPIHFDPLAFSRMRAREQLEMTKELVGLDFTLLDAQRQAAFEERTEVNRGIKTLEAQLAALERHPAAPAEPVSVDALEAEYKAKQRENEARSKALEQKAGLERQASIAEMRIAELEKELKKQKAALKAAQSQIAAAQTAVDAMAQHDLSQIMAQMKEANTVNAQVQANQRAASLEAELEERRAESAALTDKIEGVDADKREKLAKAAFPVAGLSFSDDEVLYNGLPLSQASSAELLRVSAAMGFALAPDPAKLQVMLIRDGSLLDSDSLKMLADMAVKQGVQIWIEKVCRDADIVVEDGEIKG